MRLRGLSALVAALCVASFSPPARAQSAAVPCGACLAVSLSADQARVAASEPLSLTGLTVVVHAPWASANAALRALLDGVAQRGAITGLVLTGAPASILEPGGLSGLDIVALDLTDSGRIDERLAFDVKSQATSLRAARVRRLGVRLLPAQRLAAASLGLAAYFDFVIVQSDTPAAAVDAFDRLERWTATGDDRVEDLTRVLAAASATRSSRVLLTLPRGREDLLGMLAVLARSVPGGLAPLPEVKIECDGGCESNVFLDAATLDAVAIVRPSAAVARLRVLPTARRIEAIVPSGNNKSNTPSRGQSPSAPADTGAVASGVGRWTAVVADDAEIGLPAIAGPFVVRASGWERSIQERFATGIRVSGRRRLAIEEILARHQAADVAAKRAMGSLISFGDTVLTFEAPGFAAPVTISAKTTVYSSDAATDVEEASIRVNGLAVATRGDDLPKLPLIEPERVATAPLTIALTEAYAYRLEGEERVRSRQCYVVAFAPRASHRASYAGRAWIDDETFGTVRFEATQTALSGPVVSSHEIHDFQPAAENGVTVWLPVRSEIHQRYESADFSTPIHRVVTFDRHLVNPSDWSVRLEAAYRSDSVIMRDTPDGFRYLRRDSPHQGSTASGQSSAAPVRRLVPGRVPRVRTIVGGFTIDPNISVPLIFGGVSYVNFDVAGTGAQVDAFFAGLYGRLAWSSPPFGRSRWRVSGDAFGIAVPYNDRAFRNGLEEYRQNVSQRPLHIAAGIVGPLGAGIRLRISYEMDYTRYGRTPSTSPAFVVPQTTPVHGARLTLERQWGPWTVGGSWNHAWRQHWTPWGLPGQAEAAIGSFDRYGLRATRSMVWTPALVGRLDVLAMGGRSLDRFSRYAFGTFDNPLRGYPSDSIRYDRGAVVRSAISWNAARRLRVDGFVDAAWVHDAGLSEHMNTFPGIGGGIESPLPFGLLASLEWGYGAAGINTNGTRGTHVVRVGVYKAF